MKVAHALVVVGKPQLDESTRQFLQRLSGEFGIPVRYIQFDRESGQLVSWRTPCKMLPNIALLLTGLSRNAALLSMPAGRILFNDPATECKRLLERTSYRLLYGDDRHKRHVNVIAPRAPALLP